MGCLPDYTLPLGWSHLKVIGWYSSQAAGAEVARGEEQQSTAIHHIITLQYTISHTYVARANDVVLYKNSTVALYCSIPSNCMYGSGAVY